MIVEILIPQGDPVDPLGDQLRDRMLDQVRIPVIGKALAEARDDPLPLVRRAQQHGAPVRADGAAVEPPDHLPPPEVLKKSCRTSPRAHTGDLPLEYGEKSGLGRFRKSRGFNVIILSPDVAGIGLTLTEANHVIHYGRWWNPATESQATDRAYRIGQTRDVHVYYPIATDPQGEFETFDEKLHALLCRRRRLAAEFLAPMPSEEDLQREFMSDVFGAAGPSPSSTVHSLSKDDVRRLGFDRFEAMVALLEEKRRARAILTPLSGDDGIDVIAIHEGEIRLIQCKHTLWDASVDADVIAEVICALDGYRARRFRALSARATLRPVLVTNGELTRRARREAKARDIEVVDGAALQQLLDATPCTAAEVEAMAAQRLASMRDVQAAIDMAARAGS
jgi:hypothetical protein